MGLCRVAMMGDHPIILSRATRDTTTSVAIPRRVTAR
jgi:hypothetical protein